MLPKKKAKKIINIKNESKLNIYSRVSIKKKIFFLTCFFLFAIKKMRNVKNMIKQILVLMEIDLCEFICLHA